MTTMQTQPQVGGGPLEGSELNRCVYLGLYDSRSWPEPDSRDEQKVREYMIQKYENKRWYVAPTEAMKEDARRTNEAALNSKPQAKPLRAMLGENAAAKLGAPPQVRSTKASIPHPSAVRVLPPVGQVSTHLPAPSGPHAAHHAAPVAAPAPHKPSSGFDLLGELGGDPFASNTTAAPAASSAGGFADFSNFNSFNPVPAQQPQQPFQAQPVPAAFPVASTPLQPMGGGVLTPTNSNSSSTPGPAPSTSPSFSAISDKYAALSDLDGVFSAPTTTTAPIINWGGGPPQEGAAVNWGGPSTAGTPAGSGFNTPSSSLAPATSATMSWPAPAPMPQDFPATSNFGAQPVANPFGSVSSAPFSSAAPSASVNPFSTPQQPQMGQFSQAGLPGMPASSAAPGGFGANFPPATSGFAAFPPAQNGFSMTPPTSAAFPPASSGGFGAFPPQQQMMMPGQQMPQQMPQQTHGWGAQAPVQQPSANPFMSTAMQQVPPPSGSTNPFL